MIGLSGPTQHRAASAEPLVVDWNCLAEEANGRSDCGGPLAPPTGVAADAPLAPHWIQYFVDRNSVTLQFMPNGQGDVPTSFIIEAGFNRGGTQAGRLEVNRTIVTITNVPAGVYFVRLRARNASGIGPASQDIEIAVVPPPADTCAAAGRLGIPTNLVAAAIGTSVALRWEAPANCEPDEYRVVVGSSPGADDIGLFGAPGYSTSLAIDGVRPGTYYAHVRALNGTVSGQPSATVVVTVLASAPAGSSVWRGAADDNEGFVINDPECGGGGQMRADARMTLVQNGANIGGFVTITIRSAPRCPDSVGFIDTVELRLVANAAIATGSGTLTGTIGSTDDDRGTVNATFANGRMTGHIVFEDGATVTFVMRRSQ